MDGPLIHLAVYCAVFQCMEGSLDLSGRIYPRFFLQKDYNVGSLKFSFVSDVRMRGWILRKMRRRDEKNSKHR